MHGPYDPGAGLRCNPAELLLAPYARAVDGQVTWDPAVLPAERQRPGPWDLGEGGYQVSNFPPLWSEWNERYRDAVRDYWRGTDNTLADFGDGWLPGEQPGECLVQAFLRGGGPAASHAA